jgi:hypothetical protein
MLARITADRPWPEFVLVVTCSADSLLWLNEILQALGNLGRDNDITLLDVTQKVGSLYNITKAGVPSVQDIFTGRCQVGIKQ